MEMFFVLMGLFVICLFIFLGVALLFPELVGITGKKAQEVMKHQSGEAEPTKTEAPAPGEVKNPR